jgi:hypothetical protein
MRNIFITGVSTGIGYDSMKTLVSKGYHIIGSVRKIEDADRLKAEFGSKASILTFDVTDYQTMEKEIDSIRPMSMCSQYTKSPIYYYLTWEPIRNILQAKLSISVLYQACLIRLIMGLTVYPNMH